MQASTWADGYGLWHARVVLEEPMCQGELFEGAPADRAGELALRAVCRELDARQGAPVENVRVACVVVERNADRAVTAVEYAEQDDARV
jgi:hypothetical protein